MGSLFRYIRSHFLGGWGRILGQVPGAELHVEGIDVGEDGLPPHKLTTPDFFAAVGKGEEGLAMGACTCKVYVGGLVRRSGSGRTKSNDGAAQSRVSGRELKVRG